MWCLSETENIQIKSMWGRGLILFFIIWLAGETCTVRPETFFQYPVTFFSETQKVWFPTFFKMFFVPEEGDSHTGVERHEGEQMIFEMLFWWTVPLRTWAGSVSMENVHKNIPESENHIIFFYLFYCLALHSDCSQCIVFVFICYLNIILNLI